MYFYPAVCLAVPSNVPPPEAYKEKEGNVFHCVLSRRAITPTGFDALPKEQMPGEVLCGGERATVGGGKGTVVLYMVSAGRERDGDGALAVLCYSHLPLSL